MKKKLFISAFMLLCSLVLLAGTTFAWFHKDFTRVSKITLGHMDYRVEIADPTEPERIYTDMEVKKVDFFDVSRSLQAVEPGTKFKRVVKVTNTGTIDLVFNFNLMFEESKLPKDFREHLRFHIGTDENDMKVYKINDKKFSQNYFSVDCNRRGADGEEIEVYITMEILGTLPNKFNVVGGYPRLYFDMSVHAISKIEADSKQLVYQ